MILQDHHEALEFDLLTRCNVDLLDLWRGKLSPRRLWVIIRHLPPDSALAWSIDPEQAAVASFDTVPRILADLYDLTAAAAGAKDMPPYPRPEQIAADKKRRAERDRLLFEQQERNRLRDQAARLAIEAARPPACGADGCDRPIRARGLCSMHYQRRRRQLRRERG